MQSGTIPVITGIGESTFGRKLGIPLDQLQSDAIRNAMADADVRSTDIDGLFTEGQVMPDLYPVDRAQVLMGMTGVRRLGYFSMGGAGIAYAVGFAARLIRLGEISNALIYFGVDWGSRPGGPYAFHLRYPAKAVYEAPIGFFGQPVYFAAMARRYAHESGLSLRDLAAALAEIAVKQRKNAIASGRAQIPKGLSRSDYHDGPMVSDPLRIFDCCLISDGAGALVISGMSQAAIDANPGQAMIAGWGHSEQVISDEDFYTQNLEYPHFPAAEESASRAFAEARVSWDDIDFAQIYDCFTISVVLQLESMGYWQKGEGARSLMGDTDCSVRRRKGLMPINTHGGSLSQAYLLGVNHIVEAVRQLRGEAGPNQVPNAQVGVVSMGPQREHSTLVMRSI